MRDGSADVREHYGDADERGRLDSPLGVVEFERTTEIVLRHLPPPPAVVADIGGGPGRYALWLAGLGYTVRHRDLVPKHVDQLRADAPPRSRRSSGQDACRRSLQGFSAATATGPARCAARCTRPGST